MDFPLEDGDCFLVRGSRPRSMSWAPCTTRIPFYISRTWRIADYLRHAGGPTRNADTGRIFLIRADGSVVPKRGFSPLSREFEAATLHPGDSVVVPETVFRISFFQGLRDWSQVFTQFALGAAAVNILR